MIISSIKPQKKDPERFNVFIDGKYSFSVSSLDLLKFNLKENQEIPQEIIDQLIKEGEFALIFDKTLKFLSYRPRSQKEVTEYLKKKEVGEEIRKMVLEKLIRLDFIDDWKFASWWIEQRTHFRPKSRIIIKAKKKKKGISREIIEETLPEKRTAEDDLALAVKIGQKKQEKLDEKQLFAYLSRRGFTYEIIERAVAKIRGKR